MIKYFYQKKGEITIRKTKLIAIAGTGYGTDLGSMRWRRRNTSPEDDGEEQPVDDGGEEQPEDDGAKVYNVVNLVNGNLGTNLSSTQQKQVCKNLLRTVALP